MGLKFRRGTTAQQSGSLAFGEPYVNTTLGTLVIGGADGDIVLSSTGTGSTGTFGAISGSGLDISGNANIAGNLTLGGNITIGDATSDNLVVNADLSSSIIPNDDNAFDLGSSSKKYRKVYATSIEATNITASAQIVNGDLKISSASPRIYLTDTDSNSDFSIINSDGTYTIYDDSTSTGRFKIYTNGLTEINGPLSVLGGISGSIAATNGVVSGSSQVIEILSSLNTYTGSNDTTNTSQNTRLTALEVSSSTALSTNNSQGVSVTNLNTFSSSALTRLAALEVETTNLEAFTSSIDTTIKNKLNVDGVISGSSQINLASVTGNTTSNVSEGTNLYYTDARVKTKLNAEAVISSSAQVTLSSTTGFTAYSTSVDSRISTEKGRVDAILSAADADKDSFAEIVTLINSVDTTNDTAFASFYTASVGRLNNLESTSASVNTSVSNVNSFTSSINSTIKTKLDAETVVSGSSQVIGILSSLNTYTGSNDTTNTTQNNRLSGLEASASTALSTNTTQNNRLDQLSTVSGSSLTRLTALEVETANLESFSSSALTRLTALEVETTNLEAFTSSINTTIKTKLDTDGVISSSAQLTTTFDARYLNTGGDSVVSGSSQIAFSGVTGTVSNSQLANSTISGKALGTNLDTLTIGTGLSGTSYNGSSAVTIANTGVTSNVAGTGVTVSGATGAVTISIGQAVATTSTPTFGNLTINGTITATGDITAFFTSDKRHKNNIQTISNAVLKVKQLNGVTWEWNDDVNEVTKSTPKTGLIAQEVQQVLPQVVIERENGFLALDYSKMVGLLVEAIKEQQIQIDQLKAQIGSK